MMYKFVERRSMGFASGNLAAINLFCQDCGIKKGATNMSWQLVDSIWPTPFSTLSSCETDEFFRKLIGYFVDTDENPACTVCGEIIETEG